MDYKVAVRESCRPTVRSYLEWPSIAHRLRLKSRIRSFSQNRFNREKIEVQGNVENFLAYKWYLSGAAQFRPRDGMS